MKKQILVSFLSLICLSASAQSALDSRIVIDDFKNAEDFHRNQQGECDATCGVVMPTPVPGNFPTAGPGPDLVLSVPVRSTQTRAQTCQEAGYGASFVVGGVQQQREVVHQNGALVAASNWLTVADTCREFFNCSGVAVGWSSCRSSVGGLAHGQTSSVNNTRGGFAGSASFRCNDGNLAYVSGSCASVAPPEPPRVGCGGGSVSVRANTRANFPHENGRSDNVGGRDWGEVVTSSSFNFSISSNNPGMSNATSPEFRVGYSLVGGVPQYRFHSLVYKCVRTCSGSLAEIPNSGSAASHCSSGVDAWHWTPRGYNVRLAF